MATRQVGISRSAFYKYKDAVRPFNDFMLHGRIVTFQFLLRTTRGVVRRLEYLCPDGWEYSYHQPVHTKQRLCCGDGGGGDLGAAIALEELLNQALDRWGVLRCEILAG